MYKETDTDSCRDDYNSDRRSGSNSSPLFFFHYANTGPQFITLLTALIQMLITCMQYICTGGMGYYVVFYGMEHVGL